MIVPDSGEGDDSAHQRLAQTLERLEGEALEAVGQVMPRDPYTAVQNALQFYAVDEIVISTFPGERSGWLRSDLVGRVQASTVQAGRARRREPGRGQGRSHRLMESALA